VSTDEQLNGNGLELQEQAIRRFCEESHVELVDVVADAGVSGSNGLDRRLGLMAAITRLEAGAGDFLLVHRLDRLARDLIVQELVVDRLRTAGTPVRSVAEPDVDTATDDPTKVLIRQILGALAQYERALIRARLSAGKAIKATRGGYLGGNAPYGKRVVAGELEDCPDEQTVAATIRSLRSQGWSYRAICRTLDDLGLRPRRGGGWQPKVVRSIASTASPPRALAPGQRRSGNMED